jgi:hypothetical protein
MPPMMKTTAVMQTAEALARSAGAGLDSAGAGLDLDRLGPEKPPPETRRSLRRCVAATQGGISVQ